MNCIRRIFRKGLLRCMISVVLAGMLTCPCFAVRTSAASSILIEQQSGRVLWEEHADEESLIASITKIMTAVVALEHGDLQASYTVTAADMAEGSSMYLKTGDVLTLEELLYGLMLVSGNDAALAVAHCVSGEEADFVALMNATAQTLGMTHSSFANPNGLDAEGHFSSARDMARLTAYALQNETFRRIVSTYSITIGDRYLKNHNKLLKLCDGCIGVKTGYTKAAGRTLVSAAERQGMTLVCVTLKDGDDWNDHTELFAYGFATYHRACVAEAGQSVACVQVSDGTQRTVSLMTDRDLAYPVTDGETLAMRVEVPVSVSAPVVVGQVIGTATAYLNGEEVAVVDLIAQEAVAKRENTEPSEKSGWLERLFE